MSSFAERLTEYDLGWLIGILEGEGCFSSQVGRRQYTSISGEKKDYSYKVGQIIVDSTDEWLIDELVRITGVGKKYYYDKRQQQHYKPIWRWVVSKKKDVAPLLQVVSGRMSPRRQEALERTQSYVGATI